MSDKIFKSHLVTLHKNKVTLTLTKSAYLGMCTSVLSKVLRYEIHYDYIKNKYGKTLRLLFTDTDNLMYEIKTMFMKILVRSKDKEMFDFSHY